MRGKAVILCVLLCLVQSAFALELTVVEDELSFSLPDELGEAKRLEFEADVPAHTTVTYDVSPAIRPMIAVTQIDQLTFDVIATSRLAVEPGTYEGQIVLHYTQTGTALSAGYSRVDIPVDITIEVNEQLEATVLAAEEIPLSTGGVPLLIAFIGFLLTVMYVSKQRMKWYKEQGN